MIGIVDGDVILYRSCHKAIKDNLDVKITFDKLYQEIKDETGCDEFSLHISVNGYEADDTASVEATKYLKNGQLYMLITIDKDWQIIGGLFYNMIHKTVKAISKFDSCEFLNTQLLTGDTVDNIPGLKGVGIVKATKLLKGKTLVKQFESVIRMYKQHHPEDYLDRLDVMGKMLFLVKDYKDNKDWNIDYWKGFIANV